jgi:membrane protein required for beta-lactamase induction
MRNPRTPIGPGKRDVLNHLEAYVDANADDDPLTREMAVTYLTEQGVGRVEARDRIEQLLLKGYLYEVDEDLRIPPRS